jgi:uncharacterized protein (DUF983 family)
MKNISGKPKRKKLRVGSVFMARCPACDKGSVLQGWLSIRPKCTECNYNFHPEPGFYLGAMMIGFFLAAVLTIPPLVMLKVMNVEIEVLLAFPFVEFLVLGSFLMYYSRILWLHLEYQMSDRLDGHP